jgi:RHS repeat-associated protein
VTRDYTTSNEKAGRLKSETLTVGAQAYTVASVYDNADRRTSLTYPNGKLVAQTYTNRNQRLNVKYDNSTVGTYAYDLGMRKVTNTFGSTKVETRTYRGDNLTATIATPTGITDFTYSWDVNKNKTAQTDAPIPTDDQTYGYDDENRVTAFNRNNGDAQAWNLSLVGDWQQFTNNGAQQNRTHDAVHELTAVDATALTYDQKGNLLTNSNGQVYTWDYENRLTSATIPGEPPTVATYAYDALGRRVSKTVGATTTVFVSDGLQEICEYVGGVLARSFVFGSYIDEPLAMIIPTGQPNAGKYYYHANDIFSVSALTDSAGNVVERYKYDPYGKVTILAADGTTVRASSAYNNPWTFTGRRLDAESGLMYYRFRFYDTSLGRFISRDPIGYAGGIDLYAYVSNRPAMWPDPLGLDDTLEWPEQKLKITFEFNELIADEKNDIGGGVSLKISTSCESDCKHVDYVQIVGVVVTTDKGVASTGWGIDDRLPGKKPERSGYFPGVTSGGAPAAPGATGTSPGYLDQPNMPFKDWKANLEVQAGPKKQTKLSMRVTFFTVICCTDPEKFLGAFKWEYTIDFSTGKGVITKKPPSKASDSEKVAPGNEITNYKLSEMCSKENVKKWQAVRDKG